MEKLINLPIDIISKILSNIWKLKKYRNVNRSFCIIIDQTFEYFQNIYKNITEYWEYDLDKLIINLYKLDISDALMFLYNNYNNYEVKKKLIKYAALYNDIRMIYTILENKTEQFNRKFEESYDKYRNTEAISAQYISMYDNFHIVKELEKLEKTAFKYLLINKNYQEAENILDYFNIFETRREEIIKAKYFGYSDTDYGNKKFVTRLAVYCLLYNGPFEKVCKMFHNVRKNYLFYTALEVGDTSFLKQFNFDKHKAAISALSSGHYNILDLLFEGATKTKSDYEKIIYAVLKINDIFYFENIVKSYNIDINRKILKYAILSKNINTIDYAFNNFTKYNNELEYIIKYAFLTKDVNVIKHVLTKLDNNADVLDLVVKNSIKFGIFCHSPEGENKKVRPPKTPPDALKTHCRPSEAILWQTMTIFEMLLYGLKNIQDKFEYANLAIKHRRLSMFKFLVDKSMNPKKLIKNAVKEGNLEVVKYLLKLFVERTDELAKYTFRIATKFSVIHILIYTDKYYTESCSDIYYLHTDPEIGRFFRVNEYVCYCSCDEDYDSAFYL